MFGPETAQHRADRAVSVFQRFGQCPGIHPAAQQQKAFVRGWRQHDQRMTMN